MSVATLDPSHPWLRQAWSLPGLGLVLQPSAAGRAAWRERGREHWIRALAEPLDGYGGHWRALDHELDDADPAVLAALLRAPRPELPWVLAESAEANERRLHLRVPLELLHLDGHFSGAPILPGVLQVGWALALAAPRLGTPRDCIRMEALKFQHLLRPGDQAELSLSWDAARGKLAFAYRDGARVFSCGRLILEASDD